MFDVHEELITDLRVPQKQKKNAHIKERSVCVGGSVSHYKPVQFIAEIMHASRVLARNNIALSTRLVFFFSSFTTVLKSAPRWNGNDLFLHAFLRTFLRAKRQYVGTFGRYLNFALD